MELIVGDAARGAFWFFWPLRVRYSEIDAQGVVFNAHYLTYFDTAVSEYFRAIGYDQFADAKATGFDFHVVRSLIDYRAPINFDAEIEIGARPSRLGRSSLAFALAIFPKGGDRLHATGELVWVNTDQKTHRSAPLADHVRARLLAHEPRLKG